MRIETNLPGFTLATIEAVEQALGSRLPNGLREAWLHDNKFEVGEWFFYPIKDEGYFNKTWDDIIRANRDERQLPKDFITVAENGSGDELGLSAETDVGWAYAPSIIEATDVLLFFSTPERALACKAEEWEDYHLIELPLDLFVAG